MWQCPINSAAFHLKPTDGNNIWFWGISKVSRFSTRGEWFGGPHVYIAHLLLVLMLHGPLAMWLEWPGSVLFVRSYGASLQFRFCGVLICRTLNSFCQNCGQCFEHMSSTEQYIYSVGVSCFSATYGQQKQFRVGPEGDAMVSDGKVGIQSGWIFGTCFQLDQFTFVLLDLGVFVGVLGLQRKSQKFPMSELALDSQSLHKITDIPDFVGHCHVDHL